MKNAMKELVRLQVKHRGQHYRCPFPNLKVEARYPLGNAFAPTQGKRKANTPPKHLIVDTLHKQGPMVLSKADLPWAGGRKS